MCAHFFQSIELQIHFDFDERFPKAYEDSFLQKWPGIREPLNSILKEQYKSSIQTLWPKEFQDLLILLKLTHSSSGRSLVTPLAFNKSLEKLIIFRSVSVLFL